MASGKQNPIFFGEFSNTTSITNITVKSTEAITNRKLYNEVIHDMTTQ
jgi:hypothetical protein